MKKRECPMCGVESKRIATSRHRPICTNLDCGLPVALWPRVGPAMELAVLIDNWPNLYGADAARIARRALRGGKR